MSAAPLAATTLASSSSRRHDTSLTPQAPTSRHAAATSGLVVSTVTHAPLSTAYRTTSSTRASCSRAGTGGAPGRVDSPPTSTRSAPSANSSSTLARASSAPK